MGQVQADTLWLYLRAAPHATSAAPVQTTTVAATLQRSTLHHVLPRLLETHPARVEVALATEHVIGR